MADSHINELTFLPAEELLGDDWGSVGCVVTYDSWTFHGVETLIIPQFPPYPVE